ncbi:uncharacterized protein BX663DRAFT_562058 [Cokeromyces recurvatus]|uniref:uncharacterized protein n=1 Tax=Cokeromyces recurvatus TaxID=90255 RepID=UPI00221FF0EF|nr:uncharacterized protein BX663DRAFT_562058 [Cokeromyces recurvatus]KAI7901568.1 hypothetical protein BX663DRAFT_562058 [Cokeromyces recurvatus]
MPSEKFRINTNGQSLRNPSNIFFDMTLSANLTLDESDVSANNDRRNAHNALERQRRELLNVKFQQLAHALPSLQTVRRPSKTMIVAKSLEFVSSSMKRESKYTSEIQKLRLENEKLKRQAQAASNHLKEQLGQEIESSSTSFVSKTNKISSLKRKAGSEEQPSFSSSTPEKFTRDTDQNTIHKKKKKTQKQRITPVKQKTTTTKSSSRQSNLAASDTMIPIPITTSLLETPWQQSFSNQTTINSYHDNTQPSSIAYLDIAVSTPYTSSSEASNDNLMFMPSTTNTTNTTATTTTTSTSTNSYNLNIQHQTNSSLLPLPMRERSFPLSTVTQPNNIHPMIFTPYYMSPPVTGDKGNKRMNFCIIIIKLIPLIYMYVASYNSDTFEHQCQQNSSSSDHFYLT